MSVLYSKDPTTPRVPASMIKCLTALLARQWVPNAKLNDVVTVTSADNPAGPSQGGLELGDRVTYRDLFHIMLMASRNDASHCLARNVGALMVAAGGSGSSDPATRFIEQMNTHALSLGATTAVCHEPGGSSPNNRLSVAHVALLTKVLAADPFLLGAAGTYSRPVTTANASPRVFSCVNLFDPTGMVSTDSRVVTGYAFPEHVASKYGITPDAGHCLTLVWDKPGGGRRVSVVMGCANDTALKRDLRTLINHEKARS
ncbi:MAG TPA: hypothetical protein VEY92_12165 [Pseudoxanthomonas sp.]|nr:hypothetical protein [Pseudoxanthomonas sp.]